MAQASRIPTRKWLATQVTAVSAFIVAWITQGAWDKTLSIALIGLVSQAVLSYLVPNAGQSDGSYAPLAATPAAAGAAAQ